MSLVDWMLDWTDEVEQLVPDGFGPVDGALLMAELAELRERLDDEREAIAVTIAKNPGRFRPVPASTQPDSAEP